MRSEEQMNEAAGIGRNILKMLGQCAKSDAFEDAVNDAKGGKAENVKKFIATTIRKSVDKAKGGQNSMFQTRIDALNDFKDEFAIWNKKNPSRYGAFFKILNEFADYINTEYAKYKSGIEMVEKFSKRTFSTSMDNRKVGLAFKDVIETAVECLESPCATTDSRKIDIINDIAVAGVHICEEMSTETAAGPMKNNKSFMEFYHQFSDQIEFLKVDERANKQLRHALAS